MRPMLQGLAAIVVLATALPIASSALASTKPKLSGEARLAKLVEGKVAGKPVHCINLQASDGSEIVDGVAIVYKGVGGRLYVNRPRIGADQLRRDDVLVTRTLTSQLCNTDTVNLVDSLSHFNRGFVNLGDFVPYTRPKP